MHQQFIGASTNPVATSPSPSPLVTTPMPTYAPQGSGGLDALRVRLCIAIGGSVVSICASVAMLLAYRRYRQHLSNSYNDLYVLGIGGLGLLQSVQVLLFACLHLAQLDDDSFSGAACIANATLQQFFNYGGQVFALGFIIALLTLRGTVCDSCFKSSVGVVEEVRRGRPRWHRAASFLGRGDSRGSIASGRVESGATTPRTPAQPSSRTYLTAGDGPSTPVPVSTLSETFQSEPTFCASNKNVVKWFWPVVALIGALVSTIVMNVIVVQDPGEKPSVNENPIDPQNFQVLLGWCWIPANHEQLRWWCCYGLSTFTFIMGIVALIVLARFEAGITWGLHAYVYLRLIALSAYVAVAYLLGAVALFTDDPVQTRRVSYVSTAVFTLNGAWVSFVFMRTERVLVQFFVDPTNTSVPGNGFSKAINHLLLITVEGVYLPSSINRFATTADRFDVVDSERVIEEDDDTIMSTRRLMHAYNEEYGGLSPT